MSTRAMQGGYNMYLMFYFKELKRRIKLLNSQQLSLNYFYFDNEAYLVLLNITSNILNYISKIDEIISVLTTS